MADPSTSPISPTSSSTSSERGLCECGCGETTSVSVRNDVARQVLKGQHMRYIAGHTSRSRLKQFIGKVFGDWTVLRKAGYGVGGIKYECCCVCGNLGEVYGSNLNGSSTNCGCTPRSGYKPYESLYNSLKTVAIKTKRSMTLSYDDFVEFTKISECQYCNATVSWSAYNLHANGAAYNLDRKDNTQGYSKDNSIVCCFACNRGKSSIFTHEEWAVMATALRGLRNGYKSSSVATN